MRANSDRSACSPNDARETCDFVSRADPGTQNQVPVFMIMMACAPSNTWPDRFLEWLKAALF